MISTKTYCAPIALVPNVPSIFCISEGTGFILANISALDKYGAMAVFRMRFPNYDSNKNLKAEKILTS